MNNPEQLDRDKALITDRKQIIAAQNHVKVIEWEDFEHELARFWSLTSALKEANQRKQSLQEKLQSFIQVRPGLFMIKTWLKTYIMLNLYVVFSKSVSDFRFIT